MARFERLHHQKHWGACGRIKWMCDDLMCLFFDHSMQKTRNPVATKLCTLPSNTILVEPIDQVFCSGKSLVKQSLFGIQG